ncbi:hypothetical protein GOBAR_DD25997 [Gossypium barbadense]|nr:hypothetical protein GOBAR_DD25997 [Gossypium barbadense]
MENDLAQLTINEEEDDVIQIQENPGTERTEEFLQLVRCFLTASIIHFPAMKSTMANLWHPVRRVRIQDLGEKRFLFQFFHYMDLERVLKVPLVLTPFWVQIHDVPIGLFSENLAANLRNFLGNFLEYDGTNLGKENWNFMRISVQVDIRRPLKRKKLLEYRGRKSYVRFKYEILTLFCFFCGKLGHNDSFCEAKMLMGVEIADMGWDLSIRAQSRRALSMNSVWLREEGEGAVGGILEENRGCARGLRRMERSKSYGKAVDPILGFNVEGDSLCEEDTQVNSLIDYGQYAMEHDLEDKALVGEEGKKKSQNGE